MKTEPRPLDIDALEQRLLRLKRDLKDLLCERMPPNYLGTRGAKITLAIARREIGHGVMVLDAALNTIDDAREVSGNYKISNQS